MAIVVTLKQAYYFAGVIDAVRLIGCCRRNHLEGLQLTHLRPHKTPWPSFRIACAIAPTDDQSRIVDRTSSGKVITIIRLNQLSVVPSNQNEPSRFRLTTSPNQCAADYRGTVIHIVR